jgi:hypothetical protein
MVTWNGHEILVRSRLIPRYFWTTASIDIYLDQTCILKTGGVLKILGDCSAEFTADNATHIVTLK